MNLIAILICLTIQKLLNISFVSKQSWFEDYLKKWHAVLAKTNGYIGLFLLVVPFLLILGALHFISYGHFFGLPHLLLLILVIFVGVDFKTQTKDQQPNCKAIFMYAFESLFAPLFWFLALDIYGLALYYLVANFYKGAVNLGPTYSRSSKAAKMVQNILDWIPMRILALSYALAGQFVTAFTYCYQEILSASMDVVFFVVQTALVSIGLGFDKESDSAVKEKQAAISLASRTLLIWIVAIVLFTFGKWVA